MIIFETKRLIVRQYIFNTDAENFFLLNGNEDVMRYIRPVKAKEECDAFLKEIILNEKENPGLSRWAAIEKESNEFVGSFAIIPIAGTDDIQLGFALLPAYWGKGFASELTKAGLDYYFSTTNANHIYAIAEEPNIASQKVLLKNGFIRGAQKRKEKRICSALFSENLIKILP